MEIGSKDDDFWPLPKISEDPFLKFDTKFLSFGHFAAGKAQEKSLIAR